MFTNVSRPSAIDVLRPFTVGDTFYADTTSTLAKLPIGATNDILTIAGGVPVWSSAVVVVSLSVVDSGFFVIGSSGPTKRLNFEVDAQSTGATLTINAGAQTDSRTLTVPVLTASAILAVLEETQTFTGSKTFSAAVTNFSANTNATSPTVGTVTIGNGTTATNVAIGRGKIYAGDAIFADRNANDTTGNFFVRNLNAGTGAGAVLAFAASDSSGYLGVFPSNSGTVVYRDKIILGANSDASGGVAVDIPNSGQSLSVIGAGGVDLIKIESATRNVVIGPGSIGTAATESFLYIPTCPGTPTGVPTTFAGRAPIIIDSTNNKLYFYSGGAWRDAGP